MNSLPEIRIGDGSGNENYRTCTECGGDCELTRSTLMMVTESA
ncbi:MAG: hypothetical protein Q4G30_06685 [Actinomycetaceae bacterium]|nr:hypothetical protein [Actinomycetaceae bacterium]